ncbi:hypothetical protein PV341_43665, partial [Streptomyces sp. PA03-1a]|nr:hypothetical protein [Streptomyces sp. PA03-1a]
MLSPDTALVKAASHMPGCTGSLPGFGSDAAVTEPSAGTVPIRAPGAGIGAAARRRRWGSPFAVLSCTTGTSSSAQAWAAGGEGRG